MTDLLNQVLLHFGVSSEQERKLFCDHARVQSLPKSTLLFAEGKTNTSEYVLLSGLAHRYHNTEKGEQITTSFYHAGSVITPHFARTFQGKSLFSLQTLTDAVVAEIPVAKLDQLRQQHSQLGAFGQRVVERELMQAVRQEVSYRTSDAKERLLAMRQQFPNLENVVPHPVIASYLGITNVSLSRLRKQLSQY